MAAGIRFVFFSPENERKTQAFGGKIGLQQDFNTYISRQQPLTAPHQPRLGCPVSCTPPDLRSAVAALCRVSGGRAGPWSPACSAGQESSCPAV